MKSVSKSDFESSELRPIYTKAFKDWCFAAIERGDFVPLEAFMCSTGKKDLRKKSWTATSLARDPAAKSSPMDRACLPATLQTRYQNTPACHLCHKSYMISFGTY